MATATSPATGTRLGTGMRPPAPPQKESPFAVILKQFSVLPPRVKLLISVVGALIVIGIMAGMFLKNASTPIGIFDGRKLDQYDVADITNVLDELKIQGYIIQDNGEQGQKVLVPPDRKYYIQKELSLRGLPRRNPQDILPPNPTQHQLDKHEIRELRADITMTLREIDGIVDALVNLVIPPKSAFLDAKEDAKAAIVLKLRPGFSLKGETLMAITNLVANSVVGLKSENVQIADTNGRSYPIANQVAGAGDTTPGTKGLPQSNLEKQQAVEKLLANKAQQMLDSALGQGKSIVQLTANLDFSQIRMQKTTHGGPANIKGSAVVSRQKKTEIYNSGTKQSGGLQQVASSSSRQKKSNNYNKEDIIENLKVNTTIVDKVEQQGRVTRLSIAVLVDNMKPNIVSSIQSVVKAAVGFDPSRGDTIAVASFPFSNKEMQVMTEQLLNGNGESMRSPFSGLSPAIMTKMVAIPVVLAVIVLGVFVFRSQKMEAEKNRLVLATVPVTTVNDISDLLNDKAGHSAPPAEASRNNNSVEQLERMAKDKPAKVADLLKTTFLVER